MSLCVGTLEPPKVIITLTMSRVVIMGRLLVGYAVGSITGVAPVFGAEIAKVSLRAAEGRCYANCD